MDFNDSGDTNCCDLAAAGVEGVSGGTRRSGLEEREGSGGLRGEGPTTANTQNLCPRLISARSRRESPVKNRRLGGINESAGVREGRTIPPHTHTHTERETRRQPLAPKG
jgi:hypothetical protein